MSDFAKVEVVGKVQSFSRTNGKEAIGIQIVKEQQANTVDVVNGVKKLMDKEKVAIDGLIVDISLDQGAPIEESINTMIEKAVFGGLIAVLIILLFLRDVRSTIISVVSIPVSIFMALLLLKSLDITLNMMTLGAITVAIGRVIDDSVVVVENIYRRLHLKDEKLTGRALVREATIEMFKPILSSTLVTVAVFAPLVFVGGMVGELFLPFALTMSFALIASLIVAITIVPALSHFLFRKKLYNGKEDSLHKEAGRLSVIYKKVLTWSLKHKIITSSIAVLLLVGSLALMPIIGFSFMGSEEEKSMMISYTPATGELKEGTIENITAVEDKLLSYDDIEIVQSSMSEPGTGDFLSMMSGSGSGGASLFIAFNPDMKNFPEVRKEIEDYLKDVNQTGSWESNNMGSMSMSTDEISYTVGSESLEKLNEAVNAIEEVMLKNEGLKDVSASSEDAFVEHTFKVEQNELIKYGLTTGQVAMMLKPMANQDALTSIEKDGKMLKVTRKTTRSC